MGIFMSKKPRSRVTEQDKAVLQLKQQRDQLKQYQRRLEGQLDKDRECARKLIQDGKKDRALVLLRKKRFVEQQLGKADGMLENIEKMTQDIEFAQVEIKVLDGLKAGNVALKQLNQLLSIEEIETIMDETKEAVDKQREIDELLHGQLTDEDEEAALAELDALLAKEDQPIENLPDVPASEIGESEAESERPAKEKTRRPKVALEAS